MKKQKEAQHKEQYKETQREAAQQEATQNKEAQQEAAQPEQEDHQTKAGAGGSEDYVIKAEDLHFSYDGTDHYALKGLSIAIPRGARVAFMGPNGAGKSTFFLCLNGLHKIQSGQLWIDGEPIAYDKASLLQLRKKVGIVFQDPDDQLFSASVFQEISFGPLNLGLEEEEVRSLVDRAIDRFEISAFRDRPTHSLSGGEKKQVSIADVAVMEPEVIILDEPAAALDPKHALLVNGFIEGLSDEGVTVLISTHDVNFAYEWADLVAIIEDGVLADFGRPEEVFRHEEVLHQAHLVKPAALDLYDVLVEEGILQAGGPVPRSVPDLEEQIRQRDR